MSSDREETRWKLQNLQEILKISIDEHHQEAKSMMDKWDKIDTKLTQSRNSIAAGIGGGIAIWLTLISIGTIENELAWIVIFGIIAVIVEYGTINYYLYIKGEKVYNFNAQYEQDHLDLLELKGWLAGQSMRDDIQYSEILILVVLMYSITQAISYQTKVSAHKILGEPMPNKKDFEKAFKDIKTNLSYFDKINLRTVNRIKKFVKDFEKDD